MLQDIRRNDMFRSDYYNIRNNMRIFYLVSTVVISISTILLQTSSAYASFTPQPRASFVSPSYGSSTSADSVDITFNLSINGHPGLVNKNLYVYPLICDYSFIWSGTTCELDLTSGIQAYFSTLYGGSQQYTFPGVAMQYLGSNHVTCFVYDPSTDNGDFCGDGDSIDTTLIQYSGSLLPVYRFWSDTKKHHFYTQSAQERDQVISNYDDNVWRYEGIAYYTSRTEACRGSGVHRFWSNSKQGHFYTINDAEKNQIINNYPQNIWKYEGTSFCANASQQNYAQKPVYRFWSNAYQGHFYTLDDDEKNHLINNDRNWSYEGVSYFANTD